MSSNDKEVHLLIASKLLSPVVLRITILPSTLLCFFTINCQLHATKQKSSTMEISLKCHIVMGVVSVFYMNIIITFYGGSETYCFQNYSTWRFEIEVNHMQSVLLFCYILSYTTVFRISCWFLIVHLLATYTLNRGSGTVGPINLV